MSTTPAPEPRAPWHSTDPARLAWELARFDQFGLGAEQEIAGGGTLTITTKLPLRGEEIAIRVVYPFEYPDVGPSVYGPPILDRHQNRAEGNFCLLPNPERDWETEISGAHLIHEELRELLKDSEAGEEAIAAGEEPWAEPLSERIYTPRDKVILVADPFWQPEIGTSRGQLDLHEKALGHGFVLVSAGGLGTAASALIDPFLASRGRREVGRWLELSEDSLPSWPTYGEIIEAAREAEPQLFERMRPKHGKKQVKRWLGVTLIEEGGERGQKRRGWVFLQMQIGAKDLAVLGAAKAQALTAPERTRRIPELAGLAAVRILIIGAGSIGSAVALELAKAGVGRLAIADHDPNDVNNAVRHVLDPRYAGCDKAEAVAAKAQGMNPFIEVEAHSLKVGGGAEQSAILDRLIEEFEVVLDASGSNSAARILQRRCREAGKIFVSAGLSAASHGGEVAVFRPDGPCFSCFSLAQEAGTIPKPAQGPASKVTPVGCRTPTFSGAGFDATALAGLVARTVVRASGRSGYPELDYDYAIVNFAAPIPGGKDHSSATRGARCVGEGRGPPEERARALIEHETRRRPRRETGGALFGFEDGVDVVIAGAYGPGPRAKHRRSSFEPHPATTGLLMDAVREQSKARYRYLGSWHSHPGGAARPSERDVQTTEEVAAEPRVHLPTPIVVIQSSRGGRGGMIPAELRAWRWEPESGWLMPSRLAATELETRRCPVVEVPAGWGRGSNLLSPDPP